SVNKIIVLLFQIHAGESSKGDSRHESKKKHNGQKSCKHQCDWGAVQGGEQEEVIGHIALLDIKKTQEIHKAHAQVNRDFGNIFSTLLPGASAKVEPPAGKTVEQGLEVKVAFNDKWKDSLQELSGGQRSLVALSLVLAMLKFRPAPIYILDEFIIVSLKEGMFNHANVLYKTKFCDGTSQVTRTTNKAAITEH
ncbi:RecF/RecN/SMC protein, partial [Ostertagia ostertagi]